MCEGVVASPLERIEIVAKPGNCPTSIVRVPRNGGSCRVKTGPNTSTESPAATIVLRRPSSAIATAPVASAT